MKHKFLLLITTLVTGCLNASASGIDPVDPVKGVNELSGTIIDAETRKPMKEVTVTAYTANKKEKLVFTDEFGRFEFDELKTGIYKIVFEKEGYRKVTREKVSLKSEEASFLKIEMVESGGYDLMPLPFHFFDTK